MDQDLQQHPGAGGWQDRDEAGPCTVCGSDVRADPSEAGLYCARCGQWQLLCAECTPNVSEHSRDAAWMCPDCRARRPADA
jgi:DNA-directed RNA polymerase subunit RPC12/RpoP